MNRAPRMPPLEKQSTWANAARPYLALPALIRSSSESHLLMQILASSRQEMRCRLHHQGELCAGEEACPHARQVQVHPQMPLQAQMPPHLLSELAGVV